MAAAELLIDCWEAARQAPDPWRGLAVLLPVHAGEGLDSLAGLTLGRRDAGLLELRRRLFGDAMEGLASCPACGTTVDVAINARDITIGPGPAAPQLLDHEGWSIEFRLPDSNDLRAVAQCDSVEEARRILVERCVVRAMRDSRPHPIADVPPELLSEMEEAMVAADPQADLRFTLTCTECPTVWEAGIDIEGFVEAEVMNSARRLMREVHQLAAAYGWTEAEILGLTSARRRAYVEMVTGE